MIKNQEIEVPEKNPFEFDKFKRQESAVALTRLITSTNVPMAICINAAWGQGKSTFLRMLERHLKNQDLKTIQFNAWENDYSNDAMTCLIGEIGSAIKSNAIENKSLAHKYLDKTKYFGAKLTKKAIPALIKIGTAGALDLNNETEIALSELAENLAKDEIENYQKSKENLSNFKENLSEYAKAIYSENSTEAEANKPLIFIIDELDRCRPTFAIELLEKSKHMFNVKNIVFLIGIDKEQLSHSIKTVYGAEFNVDGYLRRFFDFEFNLSIPPKTDYIPVLFEKFRILENRTEFRAQLKSAEKLLSLYAKSLKLTLREQEHCVALFNLYMRTRSIKTQHGIAFTALLIILKIKTPTTYKLMTEERIHLPTILESTALKNTLELQDKSIYLEVFAYLTYSDPSNNGMETNEYINNAISEASSPDPFRHEYARKILAWHREMDNANLFGNLQLLINDIEILNSFGIKN